MCEMVVGEKWTDFIEINIFHFIFNYIYWGGRLIFNHDLGLVIGEQRWYRRALGSKAGPVLGGQKSSSPSEPLRTVLHHNRAIL